MSIIKATMGQRPQRLNPIIHIAGLQYKPFNFHIGRVTFFTVREKYYYTLPGDTPDHKSY